MIEIKTLNGKLNLDESQYRLPPQDYIDAINITKDAIEGSNDNVVSNIVANRIAANQYIQSKFFSNQTYNLFSNVYDNGNGTQTVFITFDDITDVTSMVMSYLDNGVWVDSISSSFTSPKSDIIPSGDYEYRVSITINSDPPNLYALSPLADPTYKCIGAYANTLRNSIVLMEYNSYGYHSILDYDVTNRTFTPILRNYIDTGGVDILGFTENEKITSINIYNRDEGDLLEFVDSLGRPTYMDITIMKSQVFVPVTRDIIDLATVQPLSPPQCVYGNDATRSVNYTRNEFFRFKQVGIDDTNRKTTCSPISEVPIPIGFLSDAINSVPTNNNVINVSLDSMGKDFKSIMLLVSYVNKTNNWSDFLIVDVIDKAKNSIGDNTTFNYSFYNDSTYPTFDVRHSILLYDYVPKVANCQELANGNVTVLAGITEGYDNDITPNVVNVVSTYPITSPASGNLTYVITALPSFLSKFPYYVPLSGVPAVGTVVNIKVQKRSDSSIVIGGTYTTVFGDTNATTAAAVQSSVNAINIIKPTVVTGPPVLIQVDDSVYFTPPIIEIIAPTSSLSSNSIPVWKWSSQRSVGIAYFDKKGVTNGIVYNAKLVFPAYSEDGSGNVNLPTVNTKVYHRPPDWAWSFQFLFTKDETIFLFWTSNDVNISEADYVYFDVTGFIANATKFPTTSSVLSYSFQDGDRLRLIKPVGLNTYFTDNYDAAILGLLNEPTINGVTQTGKQFLKIKKVAPFTNATFTPNNKNYEIEIYRPSQQSASAENQVYYECGRQYAILNPETASRVHSGEVTDQSVNLATPAEFNFTKGSTYYRQRIIALNDTTTILFNVQDLNIIDDYISAVNSIDGRPNQIDINARRAYYGATIRHSEAYQANTNINGLNRFYPDSFIDVDYSYGSIERIKTRDRFIRVFQQYKIGSIPIYSQINKSPTGVLNVVTDKLLNPVQYYIGNVGIGTAKESLSSNNYADYGVDNYNGNVWRVSNDGVDILSLVYKINSWATEKLPLRTGNYKVYGAFDRRVNNYICALEQTQTDLPYTITFDEDSKGFESFLTMYPEMMCTLGTLLVSFKDGNLYTHDDVGYNNFFGVQYDSSITPVFNKNELEKKSYTAVSELASEVWDCPEIITSSNEYGRIKQTSELIEADFGELEGDFHASFLRASNSDGGLLEGSGLKGNLCSIKFRKKMLPPPNNNLITLALITVSTIDSPLTNK